MNERERAMLREATERRRRELGIVPLPDPVHISVALREVVDRYLKQPRSN